MKDEMQNLTDLIGALAEDIEEIKTIVKTKDAPDTDEMLERLWGETGIVYPFLWRQLAGEYQRHFQEQGSHRCLQEIAGR